MPDGDSRHVKQELCQLSLVLFSASIHVVSIGTLGCPGRAHSECKAFRHFLLRAIPPLLRAFNARRARKPTNRHSTSRVAARRRPVPMLAHYHATIGRFLQAVSRSVFTGRDGLRRKAVRFFDYHGDWADGSAYSPCLLAAHPCPSSTGRTIVSPAFSSISRYNASRCSA